MNYFQSDNIHSFKSQNNQNQNLYNLKEKRINTENLIEKFTLSNTENKSRPASLEKKVFLDS